MTKRGAPRGNKNATGNKGGRAPAGNKNALGNKGGAAPVGNRNAVTTGEYESLYMDVLSDNEKEIYENLDTSSVFQIDENIRLLSIRERRMLMRLNEIVSGMTEKERAVVKELHKKKIPVKGRSNEKQLMIKQELLVETEVKEKEYRKIDDILKIEDALTRIQDKKLRAIKLKNELGLED
ncbi:terminase [Virgibacillus salexigens]|uniref:Uncharacterized protein n=1 Tax=Virgibacillus kapii TaxID=1638645 RepID=A0ABQ2DA58_9BACI|nr:terminase [Virgibacillus kapii]GGJ51100.1 hypothetical protein GCM10007111_11660 [Virgibacillus kapii]